MKSFEFRLPVLWLAILGIVSGVLSTYAPDALEKYTILEVPIYQGFVFGLVIGCGIFRWGNESWASALLALVVTIAAWIAAVRGFNLITDDAKTNLYIGSLLAGAVGAAGAIIGGAFTIQKLRNPRFLIMTVFVGALAGLLVVPEAQSSTENFLLLLVVWQAVVAASIGYALTSN